MEDTQHSNAESEATKGPCSRTLKVWDSFITSTVEDTLFELGGWFVSVGGFAPGFVFCFSKKKTQNKNT